MNRHLLAPSALLLSAVALSLCVACESEPAPPPAAPAPSAKAQPSTAPKPTPKPAPATPCDTARAAAVDGELKVVQGGVGQCVVSWEGPRPEVMQNQARVQDSLLAQGFSEDLGMAADGPEGSHAVYTRGSTRCTLDLRFGGPEADARTALELICPD